MSECIGKIDKKDSEQSRAEHEKTVFNHELSQLCRRSTYNLIIIFMIRTKTYVYHYLIGENERIDRMGTDTRCALLPKRGL